MGSRCQSYERGQFSQSDIAVADGLGSSPRQGDLGQSGWPLAGQRVAIESAAPDTGPCRRPPLAEHRQPAGSSSSEADLSAQRARGGVTCVKVGEPRPVAFAWKPSETITLGRGVWDDQLHVRYPCQAFESRGHDRAELQQALRPIIRAQKLSGRAFRAQMCRANRRSAGH